jgi:hypothetical protein
LVGNEHIERINLNEADFITKGSHNLVYRHPTNPNYLIKVMGIVKVLALPKGPIIEQGLDQRLINQRWIGRTPLARMVNRFRLSKAHVREFMEIVRLRFHCEFLFQPPPFMQQVVAFVDTNFGFAMVVRAERDRHGAFAPTLRTLIKHKKLDATAKAQLEIFCTQLKTYDLIVSDLNMDNIVYSYSKTHGDHFVLIDGIGDKTIVPLLRYSYPLRQFSKLCKIKKLQKKVKART